MNWTFGYITNGSQDNYLENGIDSILAMNIPHPFEILIVGNTKLHKPHMRVIPFDDRAKFPDSWITRKKNLLAHHAKYENLVVSHDYVTFDRNWYNAFVEFGEDWEVCMNRIVNADGYRFRDWTNWLPSHLDYNDHSQTHDMYVSGTYFCVKRSYLLKNPFDERLFHNQSEDIEWSLRCRNFWKYRCNPKSIVHLLKLKEHNPQRMAGI